MSRCHRLLAPVVAYLLLVVPATAEKRVALVVGNSAYAQANPLPNPVNDAGDMAAALTEVGFEVILGLDLKKPQFDAKVRDFARALERADVAVFFYAGHGLQASGRNYLVPVDASLQVERDLDFEAVSVDFVLKQMELEREGKTNVVFLDACRDNPLARNLARSMGTRSTAIGQGLAQVQTGVGTFIAYSTQPGNVAIDGQGRNSPFTAALTKGVREAGRNLTSVMIDVRKDVLAVTGGKQVPWDHSALTGDFYFQTASAPGTLPKAASPGLDADAVQKRLRELEEEVKKKSDPQQTANMVALAQARERLRQSEEANKQDQKKIFDIQYNSSRNPAPGSGADTAMQIGSIQTQMARRGQEMKTLREQIAKLEADLGLAPQPAGAPAK
jgi:caspase domain-containing protein